MKSDGPCPNARHETDGSVELDNMHTHIKSFVRIFLEIIVFTCWIYDRTFRVVREK